MEEKFLAVLLDIKDAQDGKVYIPNGIVVGKKIDNRFIDKDNKEYHLIGEKDYDGTDLISFTISVSALEKIYDTDNLETIINNYIETVRKYFIVYNEEGYNFIYNNEVVVSFSDFQSHFINELNNIEGELDYKVLYKQLSSRVFMQDEAIKKVFLALSLHYIDEDETEKAKVIIDGKRGTGKTEIINVLKECMPVSVLVEDLGDTNFSFDALFLSLLNTKNISKCPILVLDNADKIILSNDLYESNRAIKIIKHLMLDIDYKLKTETGTINYPTKDFSIIIMGDFSKRIGSVINDYKEGVPIELSKLTNYNIKMNPVTKELVYKKLFDKEYGSLAHYARYLDNFGIKLGVDNRIIDKIVEQVMRTNMHELDKIVEKCFEELIFEVLTSDNKYTEATITVKTLKNNKKYLLK